MLTLLSEKIETLICEESIGQLPLSTDTQKQRDMSEQNILRYFCSLPY